jgi:hypothetical protein
LVESIAWAEQIVRDEAFVTNPGQHCMFCDFVSICPAKGAPAVVRQ